ncbi:MAG TPA: alpha-L-rhamnosidase C-terminal domain-containing protein [Acidobacteriaceae bacterium]|nr:alpha-L-rhamnosidase C-terminal domain-containing protein [Acidobacteriaceae bacterium]
MRMRNVGVAGVVLVGYMVAGAQDLPLTQNLTPSTVEPLDASRGVTASVLESSIHQPLPEQYVWTATEGPKNGKLVYKFPAITAETEPHYFRAHFHLDSVPGEATLYIAGPRSVSVWVNGKMVEKVASDTSSPLGMHVFATSVAQALHAGDNVIAIKAVRGRGVTGFANSRLVQQQTSGRVLVAKIVPRAEGVEAPDLMHSGPEWRSSTTAEKGWEQPGFRDAGWKAAEVFGGIESSIEMYQWNADAGLYNWPGYDGISPFLAHMPLRVTSVMASYAGRGGFDGLKNLETGSGDVIVHLPAAKLTDAEAPSVILDFGRELTGRLEIDSDSDEPMSVTVQVGESESEALKAPYLGVNQMTIPPHGTGHSPKTAFRFAKVGFVSGVKDLRVKSIHADHIYYPVKYLGSFESSDPLLNRIWETGAYTAHLCMQDGVWDASKRDRGRWMGDTDVSGPVIEDVFADKILLEDTLDRLLGADPKLPVDQHVNGIPGYSSFWFTGVADFYRHTGDKAFLEREHERMLELLHVVDGEFDNRNIYANNSKVWLYVDWSPDLNGDTPETRRATTLEFVRAYREAAFLLHEIGDEANAAKYRERAETVKAAADKYLTDASGTFGPRWETNAAAVISGAAGPDRYDAIWRDVLSKVGQPAGPGLGHGPIISPYYGDYVLRAMAEMNHRDAALAWIRQFWGGMIGEGATSFWEAYDVDWYHEDFHSSLQADNRSGYFVSLAHGWSSGPAAWLMEEVLGIKPTGAGFSTVSVRPDLVDLQWARGTMPTPHGLIKVDAHKKGSATEIVVDVPEGVVTRLSVPVSGARVVAVRVNGKSEQGESAEGGARRVVVLDHAGHYVVSE